MAKASRCPVQGGSCEVLLRVTVSESLCGVAGVRETFPSLRFQTFVRFPVELGVVWQQWEGWTVFAPRRRGPLIAGNQGHTWQQSGPAASSYSQAAPSVPVGKQTSWGAGRPRSPAPPSTPRPQPLNPTRLSEGVGGGFAGPHGVS